MLGGRLVAELDRWSVKEALFFFPHIELLGKYSSPRL